MGNVITIFSLYKQYNDFAIEKGGIQISVCGGIGRCNTCPNESGSDCRLVCDNKCCATLGDVMVYCMKLLCSCRALLCYSKNTYTCWHGIWFMVNILLPKGTKIPSLRIGDKPTLDTSLTKKARIWVEKFKNVQEIRAKYLKGEEERDVMHEFGVPF